MAWKMALHADMNGVLQALGSGQWTGWAETHPWTTASEKAPRPYSLREMLLAQLEKAAWNEPAASFQETPWPVDDQTPWGDVTGTPAVAIVAGLLLCTGTTLPEAERQAEETRLLQYARRFFWMPVAEQIERRRRAPGVSVADLSFWKDGYQTDAWNRTAVTWISELASRQTRGDSEEVAHILGQLLERFPTLVKSLPMSLHPRDIKSPKTLHTLARHGWVDASRNIAPNGLNGGLASGYKIVPLVIEDNPALTRAQKTAYFYQWAVFHLRENRPKDALNLFAMAALDPAFEPTHSSLIGAMASYKTKERADQRIPAMNTVHQVLRARGDSLAVQRAVMFMAWDAMGGKIKTHPGHGRHLDRYPLLSDLNQVMDDLFDYVATTPNTTSEAHRFSVLWFEPEIGAAYRAGLDDAGLALQIEWMARNNTTTLRWGLGKLPRDEHQSLINHLGPLMASVTLDVIHNPDPSRRGPVIVEYTHFLQALLEMGVPWQTDMDPIPDLVMPVLQKNSPTDALTWQAAMEQHRFSATVGLASESVDDPTPPKRKVRM
jgi:hypothetical protein